MNYLEFNKVSLEFMKRVSDSVERIFLPVLEPYGLTMVQARVLFCLQIEESVTVGRVAALSGQNSGNASTFCKKMEQEGYIRRARDGADERVVNLRLEDKGRQVIAKIEEELEIGAKRHFEDITEQEFCEVLECMRKIGEFLSKITEKAERDK